jgi:putative FmdB family regulatory protein
MPIYQYRCLDCDHAFDRLRSMKTADDPVACAHCEGLNTRRNKINPFMALSRGSKGGENSALAGTLDSCSGSCAGCSRPCGSRF